MRNVKAILVALGLALMLGATVLAEEPADSIKEDVVLLKNGASIHGKIIKNEPGKEIQIERADGELFTVPYDRVETITDEEGLDSLRQDPKDEEPWHKKPMPWMNITHVGLVIGDGADIFAAYTSNGFMLPSNVFLGLGLGWMNLEYFNDQGWADLDGDQIPIMVDVRVFRQIGRFSPYLQISPGYSIGIGYAAHGDTVRVQQEAKVKGGFTANAALGATFEWGTLDPLIQVGYLTQNYKIGETKRTLNALSVLVGFMF